MMLTCMLYQLCNEEEDYYVFYPNYVLFIVKCPCVIVLHICLYPEVNGGMNIMKYTNNHPHRFVKHGSEIGFIIGLL